MNKLIYCFIIIALLFTGCSNQYSGLGFPYSMKNKQAKIDEITIPEEGQDVIKATEEILNASVEKIPTITAVGYAVVSTQPGKNVAQKRLMAIRAARMGAMRELAEQIHGLKIDSRTTVIDLVTQNDTFRAMVQGTIRGAKTVRINPTGDDTYETVLEIDREIMLLLLREARNIKA
jgi:outer membrane protein FlgP